MFYVSKELNSFRNRNHAIIRTFKRTLQGGQVSPEYSAFAHFPSAQEIPSKLLLNQDYSRSKSSPNLGANEKCITAIDLLAAGGVVSPGGTKDLRAYLKQLQKYGEEHAETTRGITTPVVPGDWVYNEPWHINILDNNKDSTARRLYQGGLGNFPSDPLFFQENEDGKEVNNENLEELTAKEYKFDPEIPKLLSLEENYEILSCIGYGAHGCVFKARNKWDKKHYALKTVFMSEENEEILCREVEALATLPKCENIVEYHSSWVVNNVPNSLTSASGSNGFYWESSGSTCSLNSLGGNDAELWNETEGEEDELFPRALQASTYCQCRTLIIKMELCVVPDVGAVTVRNWLNQRNSIDWRQTVGIARDIVAGLKTVHNENYIHRDLKPENILLTTRKDGSLCAKLCGTLRSYDSNLIPLPDDKDFGLVTLDKGKSSSPTRNTEGVIENKCDLTSGLGTYVYSAPEQLDSKKYDSSCDLFSLGIMLFEMFNDGFVTGMERALVIERLRNGTFDFNESSFLENHSERNKAILVSLIKDCLNHNPKLRPSLDTVGLSLGVL